MRRVDRHLAAVLVSALLAFAGSRVSAHEGHHHTAMGTVKANSAETLDLTTKDGSAVSFLWTPDSRVVRSEKSGERTSIGVGERAAVIYEEKDGKNRIVEVRLAATAP